ncbi:MAG: hypothetical protein ACKODX_07385, partial [Gemmata sp.]
MPVRLMTTLGLLALLLSGCSSTPPNKVEPVTVTITVKLPNGQPGPELTLLLLPTSENQVQGGGRTDAAGKVQSRLTPGKYTIAFDAPPASVPDKYHSNDSANAVQVTE